ncbi:MAG: pyridoxal phosphate-dependent aminotransferase [Limisphaerales bacterium]
MLTTSERVAAVQSPIIPQVADWIRAHPGTLSLGQGVAGYAPPREAWDEIELLRGDPALNRYQSVDGLPGLTEALRSKLSRVNGMDVGPGRALMVTAGANAAFQQVILAICDPGDEVILPVPYYFNQEMALVMAHARPVLVPVDAADSLDVDAIERAVTSRTRAVVTVSPNNPSGAVYPEASLRAVQDLCARRGVYHISDETYEAFTFAGARHFSPGSIEGSEERTISLFSFSKAYGFASWRIGCVVYPEALAGAMRKIQDTLMVCPPVVSQLAALGCLKAGDGWLAARVDEVARTRARVLDGLRGVEDLAGWGASEGAFYVLLRLRSRVDVLDLTRRLIVDHRVAVIPGTAFGLREEACLRVAYGALTPETAVEGVGRLTEGLRALTRR